MESRSRNQKDHSGLDEGREQEGVWPGTRKTKTRDWKEATWGPQKLHPFHVLSYCQVGEGPGPFAHHQSSGQNPFAWETRPHSGHSQADTSLSPLSLPWGIRQVLLLESQRRSIASFFSRLEPSSVSLAAPLGRQRILGTVRGNGCTLPLLHPLVHREYLKSRWTPGEITLPWKPLL